jgi:septum formation protein
MDIILASTSPYRKRLLERLGVAFHCLPPDIDESPLHGEPPQAMARRLAQAKAQAIADIHPKSLVIGSDQVASLDGGVMGKPGNHEAAAAQLRASSGREVKFYTGLALVCSERQLQRTHVELFSAHFRSLTEQQINDYLQREQPFDCAGSFKVEGLGIALFTGLQGNDPSSLEGLPLIALVALLEEAGVQVLRR